MTREYWNRKFAEKGFNGDWAIKPSMFSEYAVAFFPKTGKILEIGTGNGGDANYFQSLGYEVIATDFSEEALKIARTNSRNIEFINLDTSEGLPFEDKSFDVVYSHMALHYFDQKTTRKIFEDIHRVLKTGGVFATMTNTSEDPEKKSPGFIELEPDFYKDMEKNIVKRYFSVESMQKFAENLFQTTALDNQGEAVYKSKLKSLVRFIGKKI